MNTLSRLENRWNPFKEMEELQSRLLSLMGRPPGRQPLTDDASKQETLVHMEWAPLVDITEDDRGYVIKAELPGVKREDVKVTLENGVLTLSGDRRFEKEEKGRRYHRIERAYGQFTRSFTLPDDTDATKVNAEFKDGLLKVEIAKSEKAQPKAIDVKVA